MVKEVISTINPLPENRMNILLLEGIHPAAEAILKRAGFNVEVHPSVMNESELIEKIKNVSVIGIRSMTHLTSKVLENAENLLTIGAFCIGTNQIDITAAAKRGIPVFNAPFSNTRSVVELAVAEMIMLMRNIPDKSVKLHAGIWEKSSRNSYEVRGKSLGIIGYGNIGTQLSVLAESLGMKVYYYDTIEKQGLGNASGCRTLKELLEISDVVSLHVDGRESNSNIIGEREFGWMKKGVIFINLSRGHVVDIHSLKENIQSGKVAGCAIDVYENEPANSGEEFVSELRGLPNTILTPHIGGSTVEAQENIGHYVPGKIIEFIKTGSTANCVNFPNLTLPVSENVHRLIHIHENVPGILAGINQVFADHGINIAGQHLKTNDLIGYVITDTERDFDRRVIEDLSRIDHTIMFRILY
jgi:D-3-phosphoglycerate dehydrogenase